MKKIGRITAVFLAASLFVLAGCGKGGDTAPASGSEVQIKGAGGYVFLSKDVTVEIDAEAEPILTALGEPQSTYEAPSCAFGDLDKVWTYPGYRIDTYQIGGVDYISDVIFTDDSVKTPEGLCIGNTVEDMKKVYGEPESIDSAQAVYLSGDMKLVFLLDGDVIKTIEYLNRQLES